jgi:hypothetical protein
LRRAIGIVFASNSNAQRSLIFSEGAGNPARIVSLGVPAFFANAINQR